MNQRGTVKFQLLYLLSYRCLTPPNPKDFLGRVQPVLVWSPSGFYMKTFTDTGKARRWVSKRLSCDGVSPCHPSPSRKALLPLKPGRKIISSLGILVGIPRTEWLRGELNSRTPGFNRTLYQLSYRTMSVVLSHRRRTAGR